MLLSGNRHVTFDGDKYFFYGPTLCILVQHNNVGIRRYIGDVVDGTLFVTRGQKNWFRKSEGWGFNIYLFKKSKTFGIKQIDLRAVLPDGKKFHGRITVKEVKLQLRDEIIKIRYRKDTDWDTQVILQPKDFE
jgi:hypothetical protein